MESKLKSVLTSNNMLSNINISNINLNNIKGKIVTVNEGEYLFKQGDAAEQVYLIVSGNINVFSTGTEGQKQIDTFGTDSFLGYKETEETAVRVTDAVAVEDTYLLALSNAEVEDLIAQESRLYDLLISDGKMAAESREEESIFGNEENFEEEIIEDKNEQQLIDKSTISESEEESLQKYESTSDDSFIKDEMADTEPIESTAEPEPLLIDETVSKHAAEQIEKINKAALLVNSNLKIEDVLQNIVKVAKEVTRAEKGLLFLVDKESKDIWARVQVNGDLKEVRYKIGEGIAGTVAETGEYVNIEDVSEENNFSRNHDDLTGHETKSMICFPIINKQEEVIGVLQLLNNANGKFSKLDEEFLKGLSIHAALALENATLVQKHLQSERISSIGKMANFLIEDIKKPILVSKRYAEHLRAKELPENAIQILDMLLEQLNQVVDLVQATSGYSESKTVLRAINVSVKEMLDDYTKRMQHYLNKNKCEIETNIIDNEKIKIDSKEFFQCFKNIVKNACEAMPEGGKITITSKAEDDVIRISFMDEGGGIPDSIKENIFEPFASYGKMGGTGLGLAITKKIVEAHEGKIKVESTIEKGTTITISLPLVRKN